MVSGSPVSLAAGANAHTRPDWQCVQAVEPTPRPSPGYPWYLALHSLDRVATRSLLLVPTYHTCQGCARMTAGPPPSGAPRPDVLVLAKPRLHMSASAPHGGSWKLTVNSLVLQLRTTYAGEGHAGTRQRKHCTLSVMLVPLNALRRATNNLVNNSMGPPYNLYAVP